MSIGVFNMQRKKSEHKKIFISWSGDNSKEIAKKLKTTLEKDIFGGSGLDCFVSDVGIASGDDWWNKIKKELKQCKLGIVCITKENLKAPWIFFESGAMIARDLRVVPLLINCSIKSLKDTPLSNKNMVDFHNRDKFVKMVREINDFLNLTTSTDEILDKLSKDAYENLKITLDPILKKLKAMRVFNEKYIYPSQVSTVNLDTMYISAPMSSLEETEYYALRKFLVSLKSPLQNMGFTEIYCPLYEKDDYNNFDGNTKAIKENFVKLKQVDTMIVIFPKPTPSSVLVEIGYGLSLCKKMIIFYHENNKLPYMLKDASTQIKHIDIRKYSNYDEILHIINANGKQLFEMEEDD